MRFANSVDSLLILYITIKCKITKTFILIMKTFWIIISLLFCSNAFAGTRVFFSPSNQCENKIIKLINESEESIDAAIYSINNVDIVEALKKAHKRGVKIRILTDRLQASNKSSKVRELYDSGINIRVHSKHKIEHNKFSVYDGKIAATGSYNWTEPATTKNSENCVFFVNDSSTIEEYQDRFNYLWQINKKYKSELWFNRGEDE